MADSGNVLDLISGDELQSQLRRRRSPWLFKTVPPALVDAEIAEGWQIANVNRASVRLKRAKPIDEALEDEVWSLLARIGFTEMSAGRRFQIPVGERGGPTKQIDVLAADDETVLVVECKAAASMGPRPLGKDLAEAARAPWIGFKGAPSALWPQEADRTPLRYQKPSLGSG